MFRSLHMKLVLILILLIVSVMAVMGTFLVNSVGSYYLNDFETQIESVMTENGSETLRSLEQAAAGEDGPARILEILSAYDGRLGIDTYRTYAVLDGTGAACTWDEAAPGNSPGEAGRKLLLGTSPLGVDAQDVPLYQLHPLRALQAEAAAPDGPL